MSEKQKEDFDNAMNADMSTITFEWVWSEFEYDAVEYNATNYTVQAVSTTITDVC